MVAEQRRETEGPALTGAGGLLLAAKPPSSQTQAQEKTPSDPGPPLISKSSRARAGDRQHTCLQANAGAP